MSSTRQIIADLRLRTGDVGYCDAEGTIRVMRRAANELERLSDELHLLRAYAEIPQEDA